MIRNSTFFPLVFFLCSLYNGGKNMDSQELMTIKEAADFLKMHYQTVWKKVKNKEIPASKIGQDWRIMKSDLIEYIKKP